MIRTMLSIAVGYFSITALNSFAHLIVSIYFKTDITLAGVANLPSVTWSVGFTILQFAFGLFGGLLATTVAKNPHRVILGFILIMVAISLIDYSVLNSREPLWYLIVAPILKIIGIFTGYKLIKSQHHKDNQKQKH
jgi:hypothetical protein